MAKKKYEELANSIIDLVGGKDNISLFTHCVTRLRFNLKDKSRVKEEKINGIAGVVGTNWSGEQLQIIIGQTVGQAYNEICQVNDIQSQAPVQEKEKEKKKGDYVNRIIQYVSGSIIDTMAPMLGCAWISILLTILSTFHLIDTESSTYQVLNVAANVFINFIPVMVANAAAKRLKVNPYMAMTIGAILISPDLANLFQENAAVSILGLPVTNATYSGTIFPILLIVPVLKYVDEFFKKVIPEALRLFLAPFCTILVMTPVALVVLGPLGALIGNYLAMAINFLFSKSAWFTVMLLCGIFPFVVMTGMHWALIPMIMSYWMQYGYDPLIMLAMLVHNMAEGSATLGVAFKSKKANVRQTASASGIACIVSGVTEPALYGINLKYKLPLIAVCIGGVLAGLLAGLAGVALYGGTTNIFGVVGFFGDKGMSNVYMGILTVAIALIAPFVITTIFYKDKAEEE